MMPGFVAVACPQQHVLSPMQQWQPHASFAVVDFIQGLVLHARWQNFIMYMVCRRSLQPPCALYMLHLLSALNMLPHVSEPKQGLLPHTKEHQLFHVD